MVKSSMCALGNSSAETKTHKGLKEDEKEYISSALQTQHWDFRTRSVRISWGSLKQCDYCIRHFIKLTELTVYLDFNPRKLSSLEAGQALA